MQTGRWREVPEGCSRVTAFGCTPYSFDEGPGCRIQLSICWTAPSDDVGCAACQPRTCETDVAPLERTVMKPIMDPLAFTSGLYSSAGGTSGTGE